MLGVNQETMRENVQPTPNQHLSLTETQFRQMFQQHFHNLNHHQKGNTIHICSIRK